MRHSLVETLSPPHRRSGFPVMAGSLPVLGHIVSLHEDAVAALQRAHASLGPIFWANRGFGRWCLCCVGPGAFELLKHPHVISAGARPVLNYLIGNTLLASDGAKHRRMRSAMNPPFAPRGLTENVAGQKIREVVIERARRWAELTQIPVLNEMRELALDVVFRVIGVRIDELPKWRKQYSDVLLGLVPPPWDLPFLPRRRALIATRWVDREIGVLLEKARTAPSPTPSLIDMLVQSRDENGQPLSDEELTANIRLLFLAGHETTASTTAWAILQLARHPESWERMLDEAQRGDGVPASPSEAKAYPFCEAIFRESVRLYGPAWILERRTTQPIEHAGFRIPADTAIAIFPSLWARDETAYPHPDEFLPERWMDRPPPTPFEISQFGGGPHFCLGYHLAWLEVVAFLVALGREFAKSDRRRRPQLVTEVTLEQRYYPLPHPPKAAAVSFA